MKTSVPCFLLIAVIAAGCKKSGDTPSKAPDASSSSSTASVSSAPITGQANDAALLKIQWPVGVRLLQHMELGQSMNLPTGNGAKQIQQEVTFGQDFSLTCLREREGGGHEVELEFIAANMSVMMGGNEALAFDTRGEATGDESNPAVKPFRLMVGKKIKYLLDATNGVERVEGVKEFVEQVLGGPGSSGNPMTSMFNEDYFKQMLGHTSDLPSAPVRPGATWPSRKEVSMGPLGKAVLNLQFTFQRWEMRDNIRSAQITFEGNITPKSGDTNNVLGGVLTLQDGKASGKNWLDPARGTATETIMKLVMNMRMKTSGFVNPAAPNAGPSTPTTLTQDISIKLIEATRK